MSEEVKKKQHFVPRMYLRNFCYNEKAERFYVYDSHMDKIQVRSIETVGYEKYLYEIRENGQFIFPSGVNAVENAFAKIEDGLKYDIMDVINNVLNGKDWITLEREMRESIIGFVALMILRNPIVREQIPFVAEEVLQLKNLKECENAALWLRTISTCMERLAKDMMKDELLFLQTNRFEPFISSTEPFYFYGANLDEVYMPLSSEVAIRLIRIDNSLRNLDVCRKENLSPEEVVNANSLITPMTGMLFSSTREAIVKVLKR